MAECLEPGDNDRRRLSPAEGWQRVSSIVTGMADPTQGVATRQPDIDRELAEQMQAIGAGDRAAFEQLYDATIRRLYGLALRMTRVHELAEEVVSDVYLQIWQQAGDYQPGRGKVVAWLCMLCRSRALDALRRDKTAIRQAAVGLENVPEPADTVAPPDILSSVEQNSGIHRALCQLSDEQRQLLALAYFRGYSHSELAKFTGMPVGTVKTNLHRAVKRLKTLMAGDGNDSGGNDD